MGLGAKEDFVSKSEDAHLDLRAPVDSLPKRFQSMYRKRRESNLIKHQMDQKPAAEEARRFVARAMYREQQKKANKGLQMPLFDLPPAKGKNAMVLE
jgi:hypothetical protein